MSFLNPAFLSNSSGIESSSSTISEGASVLSKEMGESLTAGTPVCVVANKLYQANPVTAPNVIGILTADALIGFLGTVVTSGGLSLSGAALTVGTYYLGSGAIQTTPPAGGKVIKLGEAISDSELLVNIQLSVLLA